MPATPTWIDYNGLPFPPEPPSNGTQPWGPWNVGAALYCVTRDWLPLGPWHAAVYKSTDSGFSWAEQDVANAPQFAGLLWRARFDTATGRIWIAYADPASVFPNYATRLRYFDTATDAFSAELGALGAPTHRGLRDVMALPGGLVRVVYYKNVVGLPQAMYATYDVAAAAWGVLDTLITDNLGGVGLGSWFSECTLLEAGGKAHLFYSGRIVAGIYSYYHRTLTVAGVLSLAQPAILTDTITNLDFWGSTLFAGASIKVGYRRRDVPANFGPRMISGAPVGDAPVWTEEVVEQDLAKAGWGTGGWAVAEQGGNLHLWKCEGNPPFQIVSHWMQTGGVGAWPAPDTWYDLLANPPVPNNVVAGLYLYYPSVIVYPNTTTFGTQFGLVLGWYRLIPPDMVTIYPVPLYLAWAPAAAGPLVGPRIGGVGRHLAWCPPKNEYDLCLDILTARWRKVEWCELRDRVELCLGFDPYEEGAPPGAVPFNRQDSVVTPLPAAGDVQVLAWRVPFGYEAVLSTWFHAYTGPGFRESGGDILWRVRIGQRYLKDMGAVSHTMGSPRKPWPADGELRLRSGQMLRYYVQVPNVSGLIPPASGRVLCGVAGWLMPTLR
jgi:hypothetical protein